MRADADLPADSPSPQPPPGEEGGLALNIIVDQDVYDPLTLAVPAQAGDALRVQTVRLGRTVVGVPVGCQPAVDPAQIRGNLGTLPAGLRDRLVEAFEAAGDAPSLAAQMASVLGHMMRGICHPPPQTHASTLLRDPVHHEVLEALLQDARRAAWLYNQAVAAYPEAGMTPMRIEPDRVEMPLWQLRWMRPRTRVFADLADSTPIFVTEDGEPIDDLRSLAPRALLMTALLRRPDRCAVFVHGLGGWAYDRITERWWRGWRGQPLAPRAVVTADVNLDFDAPVNDRAALARAVWFRHHLPHNIDRQLSLDDALARRKGQLLAHMDDDRDKARRRAAFDELHRINDQLCRRYPQRIAAAEHGLARARDGVRNRAIARKRDWFFGLYPVDQMRGLRRMMADQAPVVRAGGVESGA